MLLMLLNHFHALYILCITQYILTKTKILYRNDSGILFTPTGHCITTALPGEVCGLDSYAVSCDIDGLVADACRCYESVDFENDTTCQGIKIYVADLRWIVYILGLPLSTPQLPTVARCYQQKLLSRRVYC